MRLRTRVKRLCKLLHHAEDTLLVGLFAVLLGVALLAIGLREFMDTGLSWADPLLSTLVLLLALAGVAQAARRDDHIRIDILAHLLPKRYAMVPRSLADIGATIVCATGIGATWQMVAFNQGNPETVFAHVPLWVVQLSLPIGFTLLTVRFAGHALAHLYRAARNLAPREGD